MDDYTAYLAHHGIKGQRWGIRRYQNYDGSLTAEGRKRKGVGKPRSKLQERLDKRKIEKAAKKTKTAEEEREELKAYLRKHPKKLPKYNLVLSPEDANEIINNINFDRRLKDVKKQEVERSMDWIRSTVNTMQTIGNLYNASKNLYNAYVEINNTLVDNGKTTAPRKTKVGERPEDLDKKKVDKWAESASLEDLWANKDRLSPDQLQKGFNRHKTVSDIEKAINDKSRSTDSYDTLRSASRDDLMAALSKKSDEEIRDLNTRVNNMKNIYNNLHPELNSGKGNNAQAIQEIWDEIEALKNK